MLEGQYCLYGMHGGGGDTMLGTVTPLADGRYEIRFSRRYAHPPERVWRAITERDHLRTWFVEVLDYERSELDFRAGAALTFVPRAALDLPTGHGTVTAYDPPRRLEYTWDTETLRWDLTADGPAACRLVLTNTVADPDTARAVAPGWHQGLDNLAAILDGRAVDPAVPDGVREAYARALD
jgi:uncharacterized protein YndB with AHSA1/START domain